MDKSQLELEILRLDEELSYRESLLPIYERLLLQAVRKQSKHLIRVRLEEIENILSLIEQIENERIKAEDQLEKVSN